MKNKEINKNISFLLNILFISTEMTYAVLKGFQQKQSIFFPFKFALQVFYCKNLQKKCVQFL